MYGGDFVNQPRSQWGPGERMERPYDIAEAQQQFADANAAWLGNLNLLCVSQHDPGGRTC